MKLVKPKIPVIVRLVGTNREEGMKLLEGTNLITADTLYSAAKTAIEKTQEAGK